MASIAQDPLPVRASDEGASFFTSQGPEILGIMESYGLPDIASARIVNLVIGSEDPFGAKQWQRYFGVDVGLEPELDPSFYRFWNGVDPINSEKKVYETHFPPVLRPECITDIRAGTLNSFTLRTLEALSAHPVEGAPSGFFRSSPFIDPLEIITITKAGPSCWLVLRKEVVALGQSYDEQIGYLEEVNRETGAGYKIGPSAIDLATVLFTRYVAKVERHTGDKIGLEALRTFSTCAELSRDSDHSYFESLSYPVAIGGFSSGGLHLSTARFAEASHGIACVKQF